MKTKTNLKAGDWPVTANHNQTASGLSANHNEMLMSETKNDFDQNVLVEIDETEMEVIVASLRVRSGLQAGAIQPCV